MRVSESLRRDAPPFLVKNSVAEAFPPTFILRNWASCQLSRFVDLGSVCQIADIEPKLANITHLTKEMCTPMLRWLLEQSRQM